MREVPDLRGFLAISGNRFTLALGAPVTIVATTGLSRCRRGPRDSYPPAYANAVAVRSIGTGKDVGKGRPRQWHSGLERGRRRTRQDQISEVLRHSRPRTGEIANHKGIRTERRKPVSSAGPAFDGSKLPRK